MKTGPLLLQHQHRASVEDSGLEGGAAGCPLSHFGGMLTGFGICSYSDAQGTFLIWPESKRSLK